MLSGLLGWSGMLARFLLGPLATSGLREVSIKIKMMIMMTTTADNDDEGDDVVVVDDDDDGRIICVHDVAMTRRSASCPTQPSAQRGQPTSLSVNHRPSVVRLRIESQIEQLAHSSWTAPPGDMKTWCATVRHVQSLAFGLTKS